jgi:predicted deacylase
MSGTPVTLPVIVCHGAHPGPTVWVNAAIHGDEIGGVEIIRRVLERLSTADLAGTLIAVPIVNVHGFNTSDRYLPDRRDLNRSFPGSSRGSLAARIAHLMMTEVVSRCSVGIDLHTGSDHRINLPQIRGDLTDERTLELATAFGAPVTIHGRTRSGSLREAGTERGATVLLYEGGEALRFDRHAITVGASGVRRILAHLDMLNDEPEPAVETEYSRKTKWARAPASGILHLIPDLGDHVTKGQILAAVLDPFGNRLGKISSPTGGIVIGHTQHPLVNKGDAVMHVAGVDRDSEAS